MYVLMVVMRPALGSSVARRALVSCAAVDVLLCVVIGNSCIRDLVHGKAAFAAYPPIGIGHWGETIYPESP